MKSKTIIHKITETPTIEKIRQYREAGCFFRFQDAHIKLTENSKSWGMIYHTQAEAKREGSTILNGKSCTDSVLGLLQYVNQFGDDDVILVFNGHDTRELGHDNEIVATYYNTVAVWSMEDYLKIVDEAEIAVGQERTETYNNTAEGFRCFLDLKGITL